MALFSTFKYGASKYGNASYITTTTAAFKTAQAALARAPYSTLIINSHFKQYGEVVNYPTTCYIGGNNHRRLAQKFVAPKSFSCTQIQAIIKGSPTNTGAIIGEIQTDNSGLPSGTAVANASCTISAVISSTPQWQTFEFPAAASLVAGTVYWIVLREDVTTNNTYYVAADDRSDNDQPSAWTFEAGIYATFKYGDGTKYGTSFASAWTEQNYLLLTRLVSSAEADNDQIIKEMMSWRAVRSRDMMTQEFAAGIVNLNRKYSVGQAYYDYMSTVKKIKCYLGFDISGTGIVQYLCFVGLTEASPMAGDILELKAQCYMRKLIADIMTSETLASTAYETMIQTVAAHAGITAFDLRVTGKTSAAGIQFIGMQAASIADMVRQATVDRMTFKNTTTLTTTARVKTGITESTVPTYILDDSDFLIDAEVEHENDKMINRITITNDENGETTTDANPLNVGDYQTIGSASGNLSAATRTADVVIPLTEFACIYIQADDAESDCEMTAIDVDCGDYNTVGSVTISFRNKKWPDAQGDYDVTVKGCPVSNADAGTILAESTDIVSVTRYGLFSDRIDNRVLGAVADATAMADAVISEKSRPIVKIRAAARGIVDAWPEDVFRFVDAKTGLNNLGIITAVELDYTNTPKSFTMQLEAEQLDLVGA